MASNDFIKSRVIRRATETCCKWLILKVVKVLLFHESSPFRWLKRNNNDRTRTPNPKLSWKFTVQVIETLHHLDTPSETSAFMKVHRSGDWNAKINTVYYSSINFHESSPFRWLKPLSFSMWAHKSFALSWKFTVQVIETQENIEQDSFNTFMKVHRSGDWNTSVAVLTSRCCLSLSWKFTVQVIETSQISPQTIWQYNLSWK